MIFIILRSKISVSPLIASILLIAVGVLLASIFLNFGKGFVGDNLEKTTDFEKQYSVDTLSMFKVEDYVNNKLIFKNLNSDGDITITGYKILSGFDHPLLNTVNNLASPVSVSEGSISSLSIVQPPEDKFDVQLVTSDNKYITIDGVDSVASQIFTNVFDYNNFTAFSDIVQASNGSYFIVGANSSNQISISNVSSQGDLLWFRKLSDFYFLEDDGYSAGGYGALVEYSGNIIYSNFIYDSNILKFTKFDSLGNLLLEKAIVPYGVSNSQINLVSDIYKVNNYYYLLYDNAVTSYVLKLDSNLDVIDYLDNSGIYTTLCLDNSNLVLANQINQINILKLDANLGLIFEKTFDSSSLGNNRYIDLLVSRSGDYYITGQISSGDDFYLSKFDNVGNVIYYKEYDLNYTGYVDRSFIKTICETNDLDLIIVGSKAKNYLENFILYSLDSLGVVNSFNIIETSGHDALYNGFSVSDGSCVFTGYSGTYGPDGYYGKPFIIKTESIFINPQISTLKVNATPFDEV